MTPCPLPQVINADQSGTLPTLIDRSSFYTHLLVGPDSRVQREAANTGWPPRPPGGLPSFADSTRYTTTYWRWRWPETQTISSPQDPKEPPGRSWKAQAKRGAWPMFLTCPPQSCHRVRVSCVPHPRGRSGTDRTAWNCRAHGGGVAVGRRLRSTGHGYVLDRGRSQQAAASRRPPCFWRSTAAAAGRWLGYWMRVIRPFLFESRRN